MKHFFTILTCLLLVISSEAQTVTYNISGGGSCTLLGGGDRVFSLVGTENGKNKYSIDIFGARVELAWTGTQWEANEVLLSMTPTLLFSSTAFTTTDPPCDGSAWIPSANCVGGVVTYVTGDCGATLPVEFTYFHSQLKNNQIVLTWETATELNNQGFEIQRSKNAADWEAIGFVEGVGTTEQTQQYEFTDVAPSFGINYYRLKQVDFDGTTDYSSVVIEQVEFITAGLSVFPNPTTHQLYVESLEAGQVRITNVMGQEVLTQWLSDTEQPLEIGHLAEGVYVIELTTENSGRKIGRFWKQ